MTILERTVKEKENQWGTWLSTGSPIVAEIASMHDFDWLLLDLEHGCCTDSMILQNLHAVKSNSKLIVRVGDINSALIARVLDWGASGIMLPHTQNAKEAEACIRSMHYPPLGSRGYSSTVRAFDYGIKMDAPLPRPIFMAQIETCQAVKNSDEIAAVQGVDVLFVGPADLKMDIGINGENEQIDFESALSKVCKAARVHQKHAGILAKTFEDAMLYASKGFSYIAYGSDINFLKDGFKNALKTLEKLSVSPL